MIVSYIFCTWILSPHIPSQNFVIFKLILAVVKRKSKENEQKCYFKSLCHMLHVHYIQQKVQSVTVMSITSLNTSHRLRPNLSEVRLGYIGFDMWEGQVRLSSKSLMSCFAKAVQKIGPHIVSSGWWGEECFGCYPFPLNSPRVWEKGKGQIRASINFQMEISGKILVLVSQ